MNNYTLFAILGVAALHTGFMLLEMIFWTQPLGRKIFGMSKEYARTTAPLAVNQGIYNGFLAAGLIFGLMNTQAQTGILVFFLGCVITAGVVGAITVSRQIFLIQAAPAILAMALLLMSN